MLDVKKLNELREILNLKKLCLLSGVNYYTVKNKTLRFRKNPDFGKLSQKESKKIRQGLEKKGLKLVDN